MSSIPILCTKCLKLKDRKEFPKNCLKKGGIPICLACSALETNHKKQETVSTHSEQIIPSRLFKPLSGVEGDKADKMTCSTMHQPWASLLVYGIKRAEGRGWNTDFRGRLWIHAGT